MIFTIVRAAMRAVASIVAISVSAIFGVITGACLLEFGGHPAVAILVGLAATVASTPAVGRNLAEHVDASLGYQEDD